MIVMVIYICGGKLLYLRIFSAQTAHIFVASTNKSGCTISSQLCMKAKWREGHIALLNFLAWYTRFFDCKGKGENSAARLC